MQRSSNEPLGSSGEPRFMELGTPRRSAYKTRKFRRTAIHATVPELGRGNPCPRPQKDAVRSRAHCWL
eukprot:3561444-Alexandrium_andersonii.AAC.1